MADAEFPTSPAGYEAALGWAKSFGAVQMAGVEGISSYGAGLNRVLQAAQIEVAEVSRPDRATRRRRGKSDPIDAYAAARTALAGDGLTVPKDGHTTALRALLTARRSAVKARTAATNQIHALLITTPAELRDRYRRHSTTALVTALARCRPTTYRDATTAAVLTAAKALAQRIEFLDHQERDLTTRLDALVQQINPALRAADGVGPDTAAQLLVTAGTKPDRLRTEASLAALCGAAHVPASSGEFTRRRLSRGGDRAANSALHRIPVVRMSSPPANSRLRPASRCQRPHQKKRFCGCSNARSSAKCSDCSPGPDPSTTTVTCGPPDKPKTSPSPPSPTTSASRSSPSRASNADTNATTPSPTTTANGSPPLDVLTGIGASTHCNFGGHRHTRVHGTAQVAGEPSPVSCALPLLEGWARCRRQLAGHRGRNETQLRCLVSERRQFNPDRGLCTPEQCLRR